MDSRGWGLERVVKTRGKAFEKSSPSDRNIYIHSKHIIELVLDPSLSNSICSNGCSLPARIFYRFSSEAQADPSRNRYIFIVRFGMLKLEDYNQAKRDRYPSHSSFPYFLSFSNSTATPKHHGRRD